MKKFKIIIDSMSTVANDFVKEFDLFVVPYTISDLDGKLIKDDFSANQKDKICSLIESNNDQKTSFVPGPLLEEYFQPFLKTYERVIYISAAPGFTGQFEASKSLMDKYQNLWIFNSNAIASTIESQVREITQLLSKNKNVAYEEIEKLIFDISERSIILFSPKDVSGLLKSGRAPKILVKILKLTKTYPVILCEEKNKSTSVLTRKWDEIWNKITEVAKKSFSGKLDGETIKFLYLYNSLLTQEELKAIQKKIAKIFNIASEQIKIRLTPMPILVHVLRHSVGIGITTINVYKHKNKTPR